MFITSTYPRGTGDPPSLVPEMEEMASAGHEILVVPAFPRGSMEPHVPVGSLVEGLFSPAVLRGAASELRRGFRLPGLSPFPHARVASKNAIAAPKALWLSGLVRSWRADHVHACWGSVPATLAWAAGERTGVPWSFSLHRWDIPEDNFLASKLKAASFARVISAGGAAEVASGCPDAPSPRVLHIGVRIPERVAYPPPSAGRPLRALVPAHLIPRKNHGVLFQALAKCRVSLHIDLAGDGPLRERLEARARELQIADRVVFLGRVRHHDLLRWLRQGRYDFVVLASEHEGIPAALMEAMAAAVPVVGTRGGSTAELVPEGCGVLVEPGDVDELVGALEYVAEDDARRRALGDAGRSFVEEEFNVVKIAATLANWMSENAAP